MRSFIFDFNGTLFQDSPLHVEAWRRFYERHRVPFTEDMFYKYMCGPPNIDILRRMISPDLSEDEANALSEEKEGIYRQIVLEDPSLRALTPGAAEALDMLKARSIPCAVATGSIRSNVDFYVQTLGIGRWFDCDHIFYADGSLPGKPDPAIYREAMRALHFNPAQTIVVEDADAGIRSAIGAGIQSIIAIDTTLGPEAFRGIPQVVAVIHDFIGFERFIDHN